MTALVDTDGEVVERYLYDAYGRVTVVNGAADGEAPWMGDWTMDADNVSDRDNELLYAGYRLDGETNLYHVRHRYHHPTLGRFISRDPDVYADGMNMYQYAQSGPITATDPMGLQTNQDLSSVMFWSRIRRMLQGACDAALMSPIGKAVAGQNPAAVARVATLEAGRYAQRSRAGEAITLETVLCDQHNQLLLGMPGRLRKAGETIYATGKSYTISRDAGLDAKTSLGNAVLTIAINHPVMIDAIAFKQRGEDDFTAVSRGVIRQTPILSLAPAIIEAASGKGTDPHDPATYDKDISPERQGGAIFAVTEYYGSLAVYVGVRGALSGAKGGELTRLRAKYGRVSWDELNARINARGAVAGKQWSVPAGTQGIRTQMMAISRATGYEVGLFRLKKGARVMRVGNLTRVRIPANAKRVIAHTHPFGLSRFSSPDVLIMGGLGQHSSVLIVLRTTKAVRLPVAPPPG